MITAEVKELIQEVAQKTAAAIYIEQTEGKIDFYKAMEALLYNYTKLKQLVENEAEYMKIELKGKSKSIVKFSQGSGYNGKTEDDIIEELQQQKAMQYQKTKARFEEVDRVIQLFKDRKEFYVIKMYYFGQDATGKHREKPYTFEEITEELEGMGMLKSERTTRRWRSRIVTDMAVCMFGSAAAIEAGKKRQRERNL